MRAIPLLLCFTLAVALLSITAQAQGIAWFVVTDSGFTTVTVAGPFSDYWECSRMAALLSSERGGNYYCTQKFY